MKTERLAPVDGGLVKGVLRVGADEGQRADVVAHCVRGDPISHLHRHSCKSRRVSKASGLGAKA